MPRLAFRFSLSRCVLREQGNRATATTSVAEMRTLLRVFESTPFMLFVFTCSSAGILIGTWVVVMRWFEGEQSWAMFPYIAFWSWAAQSTFRAMRNRRETEIAERERLNVIMRGVVHVGAPLEEAIQSSRAHVVADGYTRYRNLTGRSVIAEFNTGSHVIRIFALDGRVTRLEVA